MAKLADASDSKSDTARCVGSTPTPGTNSKNPAQPFVDAGFFVYAGLRAISIFSVFYSFCSFLSVFCSFFEKLMSN